MSASWERKRTPPFCVSLRQQCHQRRPPSNVWLLYQIFSLFGALKEAFFVRSEEVIPCPCCHGHLGVAGSRRRGYIQSSGEKSTLIIRRMRCKQCNKVHHELPDILVPYKRYDAASIEEIVTKPNPAVAADESTLYRLRRWFAGWSDYAVGCLFSIASRFQLPVEEWSSSSQSSLQRIGHFVGNADKWMARAVRSITNTHLWTHTRCAFLSASSQSTFMLTLP